MKARYPDVWSLNRPGYSSGMTVERAAPTLPSGGAVPAADPAARASGETT